MLETNREVLANRWPDLLALMEGAPLSIEVAPSSTPDPTLIADGIHLTSGRDRLGEARLQAQLIPADSTRATVYGLALGDLPRVLLGRAQLKHLRVVLLHPGLAYASLGHFDQSSWLADPRVELIHGASELELARPFAAAPACLRLAAGDSARIRDLVTLELATPHIRDHFAAREAGLAERVEVNRGRLLADGDVAELFGTHPGETALIAAAGPSLAQHLATLAVRPAGTWLLAVDAALEPLLAAGARPDIVLTLEPNRDGLLPFFAGDLSPLRDSLLVYAPIVHGDVLDLWPGRRLATYTDHPRYDALTRELPRATLFSSGSVLHPAVDLAVRAGASRVVLLGADFGFPGGQSHVPGSHYARAMDPALGGGAQVLDGRSEGLSSLPNLIGYLRDLERYIATHPETEFLNAGLDGAHIQGAPYAEEALHG